ncbi:MAG: type I DNA topoisomerase [Dehalococcoidia bacterium]
MAEKKTRKKKKGKSLVIVESPAKARTLAGILGSEYDIRSSVGHVRDLPKTRLGVDVDNGFAPRYLVPKEKAAVVKELKKAAAGAETIYLATDPDREGEAISWHLVEAADLQDRPHQRVVFHEITKDAVLEAFKHPRTIDQHLVDAQQARRVLDRLVGYKVSPILWKKIRRGLSAGRVQSVALRIVVEREREITSFVPVEYWTIDVDVEKAGVEPGFSVRLVGPVGEKKFQIPNGAEAERLNGLLGSSAYTVTEVKQKPQSRKPAPPFTTSTLQQEASRRLGFTARRTMSVAQQLYEGLELPGEGQTGLITYMRTDSMNIAESARSEARAYIGQRYGNDFVPPSPRVYRTKAKGAQEAHEAIRPTSVARDPSALRHVLSRDQFRLYQLVWQRFVACQMADAILDQTTIEVNAQPGAPDALSVGSEKDASKAFLLRVTESVLRFAGYRQLYEEMRDDDEEEEEPPRALPELAQGDALRSINVRPDQHFTEPPPRYTEATLVKALEENGIGRPSTYAAILSTIQDRAYVKREGRTLFPQELGFVVNDMLMEHFKDVFDVGFTASMEEELDEIARGEIAWEPVVREIYEPLQALVEKAADAPRVEEVTDELCEKCGKPMIKRWGRFGQFLACSGFPECRNTKPLDSDGEPEVTDEKCPECAADMVMRGGRFGKFLACSRYPDCKGSKPLLKKVGVACPKCAGDIVERRTRQRRIFYGCAKYPECDFTSWSRPLPEPCPQCKGILVAVGSRARADGQTTARCPNTDCGWRGSIADGDRELVAATA